MGNKVESRNIYKTNTNNCLNVKLLNCHVFINKTFKKIEKCLFSKSEKFH